MHRSGLTSARLTKFLFSSLFCTFFTLNNWYNTETKKKLKIVSYSNRALHLRKKSLKLANQRLQRTIGVGVICSDIQQFWPASYSVVWNCRHLSYDSFSVVFLSSWSRSFSGWVASVLVSDPLDDFWWKRQLHISCITTECLFFTL